jgi:cyclophilin family peptidyl-prolyl cis-trans isomerase
MAQLHKDFPNDLRLIFRYYPLIGTPQKPFHDKAALSAQAAVAAGKQAKFWEMHDFLFEKQGEWASLTVSQFSDWLSEAADTLKLDKAQFEKDLVDPANVAMIQKAWDDASSTGIPGTPFLIVNGQIWPNNLPMDYSTISAIIKVDLLEKRQFTSCPDMTIDLTKRYTATLHTSKGDIVLDLYADKAPLAVNNFIFLARHGWYDGVTFFRVLPGFVAQTGDPTDSGMGNPGYAFDNEISPDLKFDKAGVLAMANGGPGTNGSQFFITYAAVDRLDGQFTIFGQVISGMDVAEKLTPRDPSQGGDLPAGDGIQSVTITEK